MNCVLKEDTHFDKKKWEGPYDQFTGLWILVNNIKQYP